MHSINLCVSRMQMRVRKRERLHDCVYEFMCVDLYFVGQLVGYVLSQLCAWCSAVCRIEIQKLLEISV